MQRRRKICGNANTVFSRGRNLYPLFSIPLLLLHPPCPTDTRHSAVIEVGTKPVGKFQLTLPSSSAHPEKPIAGVSPRDNGENEHCHPPHPPVRLFLSFSLSIAAIHPHLVVVFGRTLFNGGQLSISPVRNRDGNEDNERKGSEQSNGCPLPRSCELQILRGDPKESTRATYVPSCRHFVGCSFGSLVPRGY